MSTKMKLMSILEFLKTICSTISLKKYSIVECKKADANALFNLCFKSRNGNIIRTTFGDNGYYFVFKVDTTEGKLNTSSGIYKEIQYKTQIQTVGQSVKLTHTFTNTGSETKSISFAIHADAKVASEDSVPIYKLDNMQGIKLKNDPYIFDIKYNNPHLDSIWVGPYKNRTKFL